MVDPVMDLVQQGIKSIFGGASDIIKDLKADPTQIAEAQSKLQQLQLTISAQAEQDAVAIAKRHEDDLLSARSANVAIATSTVAPMLDKIAPYILASLVTCGFFGLLAYMCFHSVP